MKQQLQVEILGQRLTLLSDEGESHIREVAEHVDQQARRLAEGHPRATMLQIALLTALNLASDWWKLSSDQARVDEAIERISRTLELESTT